MSPPQPTKMKCYPNETERRRLQKERIQRYLSTRLRALNLNHHCQRPGRPARVARTVQPPTGEQIERLVEEAEGLVRAQNQQLNPTTMFLAMLLILAWQTNNVSAHSYWAFFPNQPSFQPVTWDNEMIQVHTNQSDLLGGLGFPPPPFEITTASSSNY